MRATLAREVGLGVFGSYERTKDQCTDSDVAPVDSYNDNNWWTRYTPLKTEVLKSPRTAYPLSTQRSQLGCLVDVILNKCPKDGRVRTACATVKQAPTRRAFQYCSDLTGRTSQHVRLPYSFRPIATNQSPVSSFFPHRDATV